ncbi:GNAT family N-acetyltransferase [Massilia antarctica]|uniref:GNAT family N-acetyltransferase n=1 Tax=Massilia antarctica TaxID=2765360 RepID=UPI0006BB5C39|nr:GNAT family N-acetyltransferase [Massilia sp. H27-R4]MCY0912799.1 GNAT family N-acetyltransferase [Massilia sp. H27-R4]CUI03936.1 COGs COG3146 [Janthinobacterium sp. CG23_2]CUU27722.1 COGs COG3146 [Janthinobacterium sp. CG23_2]
MNYRTHIVSSLSEIGQPAWDALASSQAETNPFLSFAFLDALHESGSACLDTGWQPQFLALYDGADLAAAMPLYVKMHSYGEYVFDWAWADAYQRNGVDYYPKLLSAVPFTPVTGPRLLARDGAARAALLAALVSTQKASDVSSTHILYPPEDQVKQLEEAGFMLRSGVQFHWLNAGYRDFDDFLATLEQKKRKNIRAERRKVREAGVMLRRVRGADATDADWRLFNRCYQRTYAAHRSSPYLNLDFFQRIGRTMPDNILLVIAERQGEPIAASLVIHSADTLFGRYWGELEHVPCLHFETAYYQPLEFCIEQNIKVFEGGAQGEHKMARGFLPTRTWSAHWLAHPAFSDAIERFLERESGGIDEYIDELNDRNPFKDPA